MRKSVEQKIKKAQDLREAGQVKGSIKALESLSRERLAYDEMIRLTNELATSYKMNRQLKKAADTFSVTIKLARAKNNRLDEAVLLKGLAEVHLYQKRWKEAESVVKQALSLFPTRQSKFLLAQRAIAYQVLGRIHFEQDRPKVAIPIFQKALSMAKKSRHLFFVATIQMRMGEAMMEAKRSKEKARKLLFEALPIFLWNPQEKRSHDLRVQETIELYRQTYQ